MYGPNQLIANPPVLSPEQKRYFGALEILKAKLAHRYQGLQIALQEKGLTYEQEIGYLNALGQRYLKDRERNWLKKAFDKILFRSPDRKIRKELGTFGLESLLNERSSKERKRELSHEVGLIPAHAVMFGLMLFAIVLMLSEPEITGFAILGMPLIVNIPFVLGAALFILNLILIERWFRRR